MKELLAIMQSRSVLGKFQKWRTNVYEFYALINVYLDGSIYSGYDIKK